MEAAPSPLSAEVKNGGAIPLLHPYTFRAQCLSTKATVALLLYSSFEDVVNDSHYTASNDWMTVDRGTKSGIIEGTIPTFGWKCWGNHENVTLDPLCSGWDRIEKLTECTSLKLYRLS
jgi:hypothetical protein